MGVLCFGESSGQKVGEYCAKSFKYFFTHLSIHSDSTFILSEYQAFHGEVLKRELSGTFDTRSDSTFFLAKFEVPPGGNESVLSSERFEGYMDNLTFYFGKGPYMALKRCSQKRIKSAIEKIKKR